MEFADQEYMVLSKTCVQWCNLSIILGEGVGNLDAVKGTIDGISYHFYCTKDSNHTMKIMSTNGTLVKSGKYTRRVYKGPQHRKNQYISVLITIQTVFWLLSHFIWSQALPPGMYFVGGYLGHKIVVTSQHGMSS